MIDCQELSEELRINYRVSFNEYFYFICKFSKTEIIIFL
jgi:hypothetical protein